jgi:hypothetical protein
VSLPGPPQELPKSVRPGDRVHLRAEGVIPSSYVTVTEFWGAAEFVGADAEPGDLYGPCEADDGCEDDG